MMRMRAAPYRPTTSPPPATHRRCSPCLRVVLILVLILILKGGVKRDDSRMAVLGPQTLPPKWSQRSKTSYHPDAGEARVLSAVLHCTVL